MENQVQLFKHEKFGQVRLVIIDGRIHFVAADLCRALEIQNIRQNLAKLPSDEKGVYDIYTPGGYQKMTIVNEPGFYRLVFSSRKKEACDFQRWVYHEVLPSIRETGSYSIIAPEIPDPAVKKALKNSYRQFINVCVYVLLMSDDTVKIGYTKRLCKRISEIKSQFKLSVKDVHITPFMSCEKAQIVERCFKEIYSSQRMKGEIFSVDFDSACKTVNHFVELVSVPAIVSDFERGERLFQIAETMPDSPEKQRVLISSAKFIVGSKYD